MEGSMTSIVPFISSGIFGPTNIELLSDVYNKAMEDIYGFGRPNKIVVEIIATRIINLAKGGERDPDRLRKRALAACGFNLNARAKQKIRAASVGSLVMQTGLP
jgi:hypothetical protein